MSISSKLQIILVTFNRALQLKRTLEQLFAKDSPVRDLNITILDNKSTDGTNKIIKEFQSAHHNLEHVIHNHNVGGNANVTKALEFATYEYVWIICDDDLYDWTGWDDVERRIIRGDELICICDFDLPYECRSDRAFILHQMTFLPSIIFKTTLLSDVAIRNAYDFGVFLFPHLAPVVIHLNKGGNISLSSKGIVHIGPREGNENYNSFYRGNSTSDITYRTLSMTIPVGFANVCNNLKDRKLARRAFSICLNGIHNERLGYLCLLRDVFLRLNGLKNTMQVADLSMALPFLKRIPLRIVHLLSCTWLHKILCGSSLHLFLRSIATRKPH